MGDSAIGLAGLGFWLFIAAAVVAGIWEDIRKRETRHATLRSLIESGQPVDQAAVDRLLGKSQRTDHDMRVGSLIMRYIALGLVVMGIMLAFLSFEILFPLLGAAAIVGLLSLGMGAAADYLERVEGERAESPSELVLPGRPAGGARGSERGAPPQDPGA